MYHLHAAHRLDRPVIWVRGAGDGALQSQSNIRLELVERSWGAPIISLVPLGTPGPILCVVIEWILAIATLAERVDWRVSRPLERTRYSCSPMAHLGVPIVITPTTRQPLFVGSAVVQLSWKEVQPRPAIPSCGIPSTGHYHYYCRALSPIS